MSIQNVLLSAVLKWQKKSGMKLSAEHRFRRNRKLLAAVRSKTDPSITIKSDRIADVAVEWVIPRALLSNPQATVCLYVHGGGFVMGGPNSHRDMAAYLAEKAQIKLLMVDYRLAPEHPFPAALDDALAVYQALLLTHAPERLLMAGDSAGGNITLATLQTIRDRAQAAVGHASDSTPASTPVAARLALPRAFFLLSPWLDLSNRNPSVQGNEKTDVMLNEQLLDEYREQYAPGIPVTDPRLSPILASVEGLPPCLIIVSEAETLQDDSVLLHQNILAHRGTSTLVAWPKVPHAFPVMARLLPEARQALDRIALWIGPALP
ncbi:MAG: alpha/beta hydrolase [Betaproteobacteria bacterium]|nr:alpha/beta hydrolase [Betaproteobacteria bacterium]